MLVFFYISFFASIFDRFSVRLGWHFGAFLELKLVILGIDFWMNFGRCVCMRARAHACASWGVCARARAHTCASWAGLGCSGVGLGWSWAALGRLLAALGMLLGRSWHSKLAQVGLQDGFENYFISKM